MRGTSRAITAGAAAMVAIGLGAGIAVAAGGDDSTPITGTELGQASASALAATGGGHVTDSELGDEEGYYEIEVTLDDGTRVDVHLDRDLDVLGIERDGEREAGAEDGSAD